MFMINFPGLPLYSLNDMKKMEGRNLHYPKLTPITKQQYRKFAVVRKLHSQSMGEHTLLSHNHKKYIQKSLPLGESFLTLRPATQHIYHYTQDGTNSYIFQLAGEPLLNIVRGPIGQEAKQWIDRCGGLDGSLLDLLKHCVKMHVDNGVHDLVGQCFRIWEGKLCYNWDTWMKGSVQIVKENSLEIENYFLSDLELRYLDHTRSSTQIKPIVLTHHEYLYKLGLFLLHLALPDIKIRTYQYCHFSLNHSNIVERLSLLKIKVNKQLHTLVSKFINKEIQSIENLNRILQGNRQVRGESPSLLSQASGSKSALKMWQRQKENIAKDQDTLLNMNCSLAFDSGSKVDTQCYKGSSSKKLRGRNKLGNLNQSNQSVLAIAGEEQKKTNKKYFSLKQVFSNPPSEDCTKIIQYLGLSEHVAESLYEKSVILSLENLRVKPSWVHKIYANGSIYLGDMVDDKRNGKGVYLFDSQDLYVGDWSENCMHGYGCYVFRSGEMYQGQLRKGLKHGFGSFAYKDGRIYQGHWEENIKFGFGNVLFPNAMKFLGFFSKGYETFGLFTLARQQGPLQFQGRLERYNWQSNTFNEFDTAREKSGSIQKRSSESTWKEEKDLDYNQGQAQSPIIEAKGERFEGSLKNGVRQGRGKVTVKNKFEMQCQWEDGIVIEYKYK